jgi:general secretion pathway protein F
MPNFRYRAMTQSGELVNGSLSAATASEVSCRIEYLGLIPIETVAEEGVAVASRVTVGFYNGPRAVDVTVFTRDLALLLRTGARLDDALELLANDRGIERLRGTIAKVRASVLAGESFAEAIAQHQTLFPEIYRALVRVGETSGKLSEILELIAAERARSEALRRKILDALQYPAFILMAAGCVLMFFVLFVLPQFASVLSEFGAKGDSMIALFLGFSELLRSYAGEIAVAFAAIVVGFWLIWRRMATRAAIIAAISRVPGISSAFSFYRTALFCRNLGILLGSDVTLAAALRMLADLMSGMGQVTPWMMTTDRVRQGGKLSEALAVAAVLPPTAIRMLGIGEETGQLAIISARVADFYEAKLQRSLDKMVGVVGPLAILSISMVVGSLIVSVMTTLLSINEIIG